MSEESLSEEALNEIYSYIVDTNNERYLVNQVKDEKVKLELLKYFQLDEND